MATEIAAEENSLGICPLCDIELGEEMSERLPCCHSSVCSDCTATYLRIRVEGGQHRMECPLGDCMSELPQAFVSKFLSDALQHRLELLRINALQPNTQRSCPECTHITVLSENAYKEMAGARARVKDSARLCQVQCAGCSKAWCYYCYGPSHPGFSCVENKDGEVQFNRWTKDWDRGYNQQNAFRCPQCKIPTQRDGGCPTMTCTQCSCYWCYNCGNSLNATSNGMLGSHGGNKWEVRACDKYSILKGGRKITKALRWFKLTQEVFIFSVCAIAIVTLLLPVLPVILFLAPPALFLIYAAKKTYD